MPENIERGIINQALMKVRLMEGIDVRYYLIVFDFYLSSIFNKGSKGTGIKNIPKFEVIKPTLFPLPPLAEQKRIVEKLDKLMALCDEL